MRMKGLEWVGVTCACVLVVTCFIGASRGRQASVEVEQQVQGGALQPVATGPERTEAKRTSIQDALYQPMDFPFGQGTTLKEVVEHLTRVTGSLVVIDRAALGRLELDERAEVQLELKGVRLKTGLRLLLDQVEMTYRVEAEDNLLVLTDRVGAEDPLNRIFRELEDLHAEMHEVQNQVASLMGVMLEPMEAEVKNPMLREEIPVEGGEAAPKPAPGGEPVERGRRG